MPRILLLHASVGTGHKRAAQALRIAFEQDQTSEIQVEDVLDYTPWLFRQAYARSYLELTDHAPLVWGYFYSQTNIDPELAEVTNNVRKIVENLGTNGLKDVINRFPSDIIVCTHFLPMELLVRLKLKAKLPQPIYCVITDYAAHTFWTYTEIDGYFVATDQTRNQLTRRGVPATKVCVSGIPVDPAIITPKDPMQLRRQRGLPHSGRVITLFGGGMENGRVRLIVEGLLHSGMEGTLIVVAGRNISLTGDLADLVCSTTMRLRILGFITYVDDVIAASDLVITKAGGLIISEIIARGIPLVVIDPIPGHEEWNADFVVSSGAGVQLRMADSVPETVCRLLNKPSILDNMRLSAVAAGRAHAAFDIVQKIRRDFEDKQEI